MAIAVRLASTWKPYFTAVVNSFLGLLTLALGLMSLDMN